MVHYKKRYAIEAFLISGNPCPEDQIDGLPIRNYLEVDLTNDDTVVIIGVGGGYFDEVCEKLNEVGAKNVVEFF